MTQRRALALAGVLLATSAVAACDPAAVRGEAADGRFRLVLSLPSSGYPAGAPIVPTTTLTWLGPEDRMLVYHAASPVGFRIEQLDGERTMGGGMDEPCLRTEMARERPIDVPFQKAGAVSDDPRTGFDRAWYEDRVLRLPPGRWRLVAWMETWLDGCGGRRHRLETSVDVMVAP